MQIEKSEWLLRNWIFYLDVHTKNFPKGIAYITPVHSQKLFNRTITAVQNLRDSERNELLFRCSHGFRCRGNDFLYEAAKKHILAAL